MILHLISSFRKANLIIAPGLVFFSQPELI